MIETEQEIAMRILQADLEIGERAYPIYRVEVKWVQDTINDPHPRWIEGLPAGRMRNATGWNKMYREVRPYGDIEAEIQTWWETYSQTLPNPAELVVEVVFDRWEVWCLTWFSHWTFDVGLDDNAVLRSFDKYVMRMQAANLRASGYDDKPFCLMGAEDRYRWSGSGDDGNPRENTPPPCRCVHCKKQGVVRIGH